MRHFGHLAPQVRKELFHIEPAEFDADSPVRTLSAALGATLYSPATRPCLADDVRNAGGTWTDTEVVVDGNLITSRSPEDLPAFIKALEDALS